MQAAKFIVNKFTHEVEEFDVLYSVDMKKSQPRITAGTGRTSVLSPADFTIGIADLLDAVNNAFSDVWSNDPAGLYVVGNC